MADNQIIMGVDIGGTGIKAALIDTTNGEMVSEKIKYKTPDESSPVNCVNIIKQMIDDLDYKVGPIGCGVPSTIRNGLPQSAANIDKRWIGFDLCSYVKSETGHSCSIINDADAAGLAEMAFGYGRDVKGTVVVLTLGTGIGSGVFVDGNLVPNTEFGHLLWKDSIVEKYASNRTRQEKNYTWHQYGNILGEVVSHIDFIISPNLVILGGSVSKEFEQFSPFMKTEVKLMPAKLQNAAGIIGAAMAVFV